MEIKAQLRYLKIAPRKVRLVIDALRGKKVDKAKIFLNLAVKKSTDPVLKLLNSAVANAKNDFGIEESNLYISEIRVDEGPKLKRWMPRARGSASQIQKKTSHIILTLNEVIKKSEIPKKEKRIKKASKIEKVAKVQKLKFKPEIEISKPKIEKVAKRVFMRKAF